MSPDQSRNKLVNRRQLRGLIPASDMTIWRWEQTDQFPLHLTINGRNYWRLDEIEEWLDRRSAQRGASAEIPEHTCKTGAGCLETAADVKN